MQVSGVGEEGPCVGRHLFGESAPSGLQKLSQHEGLLEFIHQIVVDGLSGLGSVALGGGLSQLQTRILVLGPEVVVLARLEGLREGTATDFA
jgi:hypothetical protein